MDEKEKYRAEIEARLIKFHETFHQIKTEAEKRKKRLQDLKISHIARKQEHVKAKLKELEQSVEGPWHRLKKELDGLVNDIDDDLRKALAYFG